ncbi:MAG TPA: hypothetical protein VHK67_00210 [Rhabdochlamydiaceae bacterium]|jgi:uncharacterized membrane protein|nr:hypothetical protein [Rhabdochlamydiaceae bacterium]
MRKTIFALATLALFVLEAEQFQVKTSVETSSWDAQLPEYLVKIEIEQVNENSASVEFANETLICILGNEKEVSKFVDGKGGYTMKALYYREDDLTYKLKTSVTILDADKKTIFQSNKDE